MSRSHATASATRAPRRSPVPAIACERGGEYRLSGDDDRAAGPGAGDDDRARGLSAGEALALAGPGSPSIDGPEVVVAAWDGPPGLSLAQLEGASRSRPRVWDPVAVRREVTGDDLHHDGRGSDHGDVDGAGGAAADAVGPRVRDRVRGLQTEARTLLDAVTVPGAPEGALGALVDLAVVADLVQTTMLVVAGQVEAGLVAQRRFGLPLPELLGLTTRMTHRERRSLVTTAAGLAVMPGLAGALTAGRVGAGEARDVVTATRRLRTDDRADLDGLFADHDRLATQTVDEVLDEIDGRVVELEQRATDDRNIKAFERRFVAVQPGLDGTLAGYFEIDDASGAMLLAALDDAAPPITGDRALTRDASLPVEQVPTDRRTLGRRRADGLVALARHWLASHRTDPAGDGDTPSRPAKRARPLVYVWTDIATLVGTDASAAAARLLWHTLGPNPVLTAAGVRRLADDARLQFILTCDNEVLGVAAPVATIPAKVRAAVRARDQGCRFPNCRIPIHQTDLHHVVGRAGDGHTTVANLVALCRRHHQAVTEARWQLSMTPTGHVTVRRGRHTASTDPPTIRRL